MKPITLRYLLLPVTGLLAFALLRVDAETPSANEKMLLDLDRQWSEAAVAKDVAKVVSYYAENAIVLPPNDSLRVNQEAIRKTWAEMLQTPGLVLSWSARKAEVAQSGEIGYVTGAYRVTVDGKENDRGKYLAVFKKQSDGSWKAVADTWNSDLPATPAAEKK
jgi:ketosteroid isomerase-like protein